MRKFRGLMILGALVIAGCNLSTDLPTSQRLGFITMTQLGDGDSATLNMIGQFFQSSPSIQPSVPNTNAVGDTCTVSDYAGPPDDPGPIKVDNLNAGASIAVTTDKAEASMVPAINAAGSVDYRLATGPVPFTPGSKVGIEIPGDSGGFPAHSLEVSTFTAPTFAPIERHPAEDLTLSWSPAGIATGAIQLQLLFSSDSNPSPDKILFCALRDDGNYVVPKFLVAGEWAASPAAAQSGSAIRWNTTLKQNQNVLMDVIVQVAAKPLTFSTDQSTATDLRANASR